MADAFYGEIRIFGFNFAPKNWAFCDGALIPISQNTALFSLLGTSYGGNGTTNFALPNFQGRAGMHWGNGQGLTPRSLGEQDGTDTVTLLTTQMPGHVHGLMGATTTGATQKVAAPATNAMFSNSGPGAAYSDTTTPTLTPFSPQAIGIAGGSQPHTNNQPRLSLNFCICLNGIFPSRN